MRTSLTRSAIGLAALGGLAACAQATGEPQGPVYEGVETRLLVDDLVAFDVAMRNVTDRAEVAAYGECAAAQYAMIRGYGFARHVRTNVKKSGSLWHGDAVYVISAAMPEGLRTIDAEVAVQNCNENGIPTV